MADDSTSERILDSTLDVLIRFGARRTTMEMIAKKAAVSHTTIYRRWPSKDDLIRAVVARELQVICDVIDAELERVDSFEDRLIAGFAGIVWNCRQHPFLGKALETDPESALLALTVNGGPAIEYAIDYLENHIRRAADEDGLDVPDPRGTAEILVRLSHSLYLSPRIDDPLDTRTKLEEFARRQVLPIARAAVKTRPVPSPS